ncbi:MAG: hypothetical protein ACYCSI_13650 [Solirubrobacteraceae bacterium]
MPFLTRSIQDDAFHFAFCGLFNGAWPFYAGRHHDRLPRFASYELLFEGELFALGHDFYAFYFVMDYFDRCYRADRFVSFARAKRSSTDRPDGLPFCFASANFQRPAFDFNFAVAREGAAFVFAF